MGRLKLAPFNRLEDWIDDLRIPLVLLGTGWRTEAQPLTDPERDRMRLLLERATAVYVRGKVTKQRIVEHGLPAERVVPLGDPGLCFQPQGSVAKQGRRQVGVVVRQMSEVEIQQDRATLDNETFQCNLARLLDYVVTAEGAEIVFFPMASRQRGQDNDFRAIERVNRLMECGLDEPRMYYDDLPLPYHELGVLAKRLGQMDFVISQRLHGSLVALSQGVPVMPIEYQFGKMDDSLSMPGLEDLRALITPQAEVGIESYRAKAAALADPALMGRRRAACSHVRAAYVGRLQEFRRP